jgi:hypothetical protein
VRVLVAAVLTLSLLAGCTASTKDGLTTTDPEHEDLALAAAAAAPTLYLNLTVGNTTHRFTSAGAHADHSTTKSSGTTTVASGNSSSSTTKTNGTAKANATANPAGGNASAGLGGDAPLNVSATLGAKGLPATKTSWAIDFGATAAPAAGNASGANATAKPAAPAKGSGFPAQASFVYATAGTYDLKASLLQGNTTLASLHVALVVGGNGTVSLSSGPAPGTVLGMVPIDFSGTFTVGAGDGSTPLKCGSGLNAAGEGTWEFPSTDPVTGTAVVVGAVHIVSDGDDTTVDADLYFLGPDGSEIAKANGGSPDETLDAEGPFLPGSYKVQYKACVAVEGSWTVHGEATLVAA